MIIVIAASLRRHATVHSVHGSVITVALITQISIPALQVAWSDAPAGPSHSTLQSHPSTKQLARQDKDPESKHSSVPRD